MIVPLLFAEILEDSPSSDDTLSLKEARKLYNMCMDTGTYDCIVKTIDWNKYFSKLNIENLKETSK